MSAFGLLSSTFIGPTIPVGLPVITGLSTDGTAEIGTTVSVELFGQTPTGPIAWAIDATPIPGATGTSLIVPASEGGGLTVLVDGKTSGAAAIRYPVPVATGGVADQVFEAGGGVEILDVSGDFSFAGTPLYTLRMGPQGVSVETGTGIVRFDTAQLQAQSETAIVIRCADAGDPQRFAETGFSLTITAAPGALVWAFAGSTATAIPDTTGWAFTGSAVATIGDV